MPYCARCDRTFNTWRALEMHEENSSNHNLCCGTDYATWSRKQQHWIQSGKHAYCQYCNKHFDDRDELEVHYEESHYYCSDCEKVFTNEYGLKEHYRQSNQHFYCVSCDRHFQSESNLRNHLNSATHRPKDTSCPFGCGMSFVTKSALVLHLEGGSCSSGVNRKTVNTFVRQYDKHHVITDPSRLITGGSSSNDDVTYYATGASWNGHGFECYLCSKVHITLKALNQHLASPRHQDKFYVCPGPTCDSRFSALSALCQHIESERCGVLKFRAVQATMDHMFGKMKRLAL